MTDDELRSLVERIAEASCRFAEGAERFERAAGELLSTVVESQRGAARAIALQISRSRRAIEDTTERRQQLETQVGTGRLVRIKDAPTDAS